MTQQFLASAKVGVPRCIRKVGVFEGKCIKYKGMEEKTYIEYYSHYFSKSGHLHLTFITIFKK